MLILLRCNAGMWKSTTGNSIAYELSKKITGIVVASDGTVISLGHIKGYVGNVFESRVDKSFNNYSHRTYNLGMLVYRNGQCFMSGIYRFDMKIIIDYLKKVYKIKF